MPQVSITLDLEAFGFRFGDRGTHSSRTLMLNELSDLLQTCGPTSSRTDYANAIVVENCAGKVTVSNRRLTNQRLGELYILDPQVPLFRAFRQFWQTDLPGRPLLAILMALARDPLLRATAKTVLGLHAGAELSRTALSQALRDSVGSRLNDASLDKVVRNTSSSWTQSGHLAGRVRKIRQLVNPTPLSTAFALYLGYLSGERGSALLKTIWATALDRKPDDLLFLAMDARRLGVLELREAGSVVDISFSKLI